MVTFTVELIPINKTEGMKQALMQDTSSSLLPFIKMMYFFSKIEAVSQGEASGSVGYKWEHQDIMTDFEWHYIYYSLLTHIQVYS